MTIVKWFARNGTIFCAKQDEQVMVWWETKENKKINVWKLAFVSFRKQFISNRYLKIFDYTIFNSAHSPSVEIESKLISSDFALFIDFLIEIPSTSSESLFSFNDDNEPKDPRIDDFVSEFVLTTDFERVTTITTSDLGDWSGEKRRDTWAPANQQFHLHIIDIIPIEISHIESQNLSRHVVRRFESFTSSRFVRAYNSLTFSTPKDSRWVKPLIVNPFIDKIRSPLRNLPSLSAGEFARILCICWWWFN